MNLIQIADTLAYLDMNKELLTEAGKEFVDRVSKMLDGTETVVFTAEMSDQLLSLRDSVAEVKRL